MRLFIEYPQVKQKENYDYYGEDSEQDSFYRTVISKQREKEHCQFNPRFWVKKR